MQRRNGHSANGHDGVHANGNGKTSIPLDWERLARATAHPLRISILEILGMDGGRTLSPSELSQELQIPLSNTNYHVTELAKAKLIDLARQRQVRGATEHFYRIRDTSQPKRGRKASSAKRAASPRPAPSTSSR
jgi:DNA-binding transcriptional ArsR family regulator